MKTVKKIVRMIWDSGCKYGSKRNFFEYQESEIWENEIILPPLYTYLHCEIFGKTLNSKLSPTDFFYKENMIWGWWQWTKD